MLLCTRQEVKDYLNITGTNTVADATILRLCGAVSALADTYCGRTFESTEHTEYKDGTPSDYFYLYNTPVTTISGIWEDVNREWGDGTEIDSTNYFNDDNKVYFNNYCFTNYPKSIKVVYTAGYTEDTIPDDLRQACIMEVVSLYKKSHDGVDVATRTHGDTSTSYTITSVQTNTKLVWDLYKDKFIC